MISAKKHALPLVDKNWHSLNKVGVEFLCVVTEEQVRDTFAVLFSGIADLGFSYSLENR